MLNNRRGEYRYAGCSASIGSMTWAMRAQNELAAEAIPSTVVKTDERSAGKGCVYGIAFACSWKENVKRILDSAKISVREWKDQA